MDSLRLSKQLVSQGAAPPPPPLPLIESTPTSVEPTTLFQPLVITRLLNRVRLTGRCPKVGLWVDSGISEINPFGLELKSSSTTDVPPVTPSKDDEYLPARPADPAGFAAVSILTQPIPSRSSSTFSTDVPAQGTRKGRGQDEKSPGDGAKRHNPNAGDSGPSSWTQNHSTPTPTDERALKRGRQVESPQSDRDGSAKRQKTNADDSGPSSSTQNQHILIMNEVEADPKTGEEPSPGDSGSAKRHKTNADDNRPSPSPQNQPTPIGRRTRKGRRQIEFPSADGSGSSSRTQTQLIPIMKDPRKMKRLRQDESSPGDEIKNSKKRKTNADGGGPSHSRQHRATPTINETETDPNTGKQFIVVRDRKKGKVLHYKCPVHPNLRILVKGDVARHLQSREHQPPSYCCIESCGKKFTRIDALRRHVYNIKLHPGQNLVVVGHENGAKTYLAEDRESNDEDSERT